MTNKGDQSMKLLLFVTLFISSQVFAGVDDLKIITMEKMTNVDEKTVDIPDSVTRLIVNATVEVGNCSTEPKMSLTMDEDRKVLKVSANEGHIAFSCFKTNETQELSVALVYLLPESVKSSGTLSFKFLGDNFVDVEFFFL